MVATNVMRFTVCGLTLVALFVGCRHSAVHEAEAPNPARHFEDGNALFEKGEYDRAIAEYDHAIRLVPNMAKLHYGRGVAAVESKKWDRWYRLRQGSASRCQRGHNVLQSRCRMGTKEGV